MKVLTVRQPWAGLIALGIKDVENRTWVPSAIDIGDRFAIHAGRWDNLERVTAHTPDEHDDATSHPLCICRSVIVCTVELLDVTRDSRSPWAVRGQYHWILGSPRRVHAHTYLRGRTGLWDLHT